MFSRLTSIALLAFVPVLNAAAFGEVPSLTGKYCGYTKLFGLTSISMSLDFNPNEYQAKFTMVFGDKSFSYEDGISYTLDSDLKLILENENEAFNSFLASFSIGLTARSFNTLYDATADTLNSQIKAGMLIDLKVTSNKELCRKVQETATYASKEGLIQAMVDSDSSTVVLDLSGEQTSHLSPVGVVSFILEEDGSFNVSQEGSEETSYTLRQIPGVDKLLLQYRADEKAVSVVLSRQREDEDELEFEEEGLDV